MIVRRMMSMRLAVLAALVLAPAAALAAAKVERGVKYHESNGESLVLDIFRPADASTDKKPPAVLLIHGGGWQGGNRESPSMTAIGHALADAGYVAFSIDYRLVKRTDDGKGWINQYPVPIDDCRRAVRWIRGKADELGVDATKLGACGDSAGGHLVSMLGTSDADDADGSDKQSARVQAVVDIFGPADLTGDYSDNTFGQVNVQDLVDAFVPTSDDKREASPILHIDDRSAAFLIFHGTKDPLVDVEQSRKFHEALKKAGRHSEYVEFPGAGHGFSGKDWETMVSRIVTFFDQQLQASPQGSKGKQQVSAESKAKPADTNGLANLFKIHYANRVRSFQEQNLVFQNVVLLGDSITEGFDVTKMLPGQRVLNRGIGADVIGNSLAEDDNRGVLKRLDASIFHCAATDVFIMIGINDLGSGRTPDVMEEGYRQMLKQIKERAPAVRVHIESLLPCRGNFAKHNANVKDFNARLEKLADEFGCNFINLHPLMADENGELKSEFTSDGLHINEAAYKVWKAEVERAMGW